MVGGFFLVFLFEKEGGGHFLETSCCGLKRNGVDGSRAHSVSKGRRIKKKKRRRRRGTFFSFMGLYYQGVRGHFSQKPSREKGFLCSNGSQGGQEKERWRRIPR